MHFSLSFMSQMICVNFIILKWNNHLLLHPLYSTSRGQKLVFDNMGNVSKKGWEMGKRSDMTQSVIITGSDVTAICPVSSTAKISLQIVHYSNANRFWLDIKLKYEMIRDDFLGALQTFTRNSSRNGVEKNLGVQKLFVTVHTVMNIQKKIATLPNQIECIQLERVHLRNINKLNYNLFIHLVLFSF